MNIQKAIDKLDEIRSRLLKAEFGFEPNIVGRLSVLDDTREILLSLQEPEDDKFALQCDLEEVDSYHQELNSKIEDRLARLESGTETVTQELMRRTIRIEEQAHGHVWDKASANYKSEPSSVSEDELDKRRCGTHFDMLIDLDKRAVLLQKQIDILKDHSHKHGEEEGEYRNLNSKNISFPYNPDYEPSPCLCDYGEKCSVCSPKPSFDKCDTITISRKVAEEWIKNPNTYASNGNSGELVKELKLALSKESHGK
jgi:hypothetical protein